MGHLYPAPHGKRLEDAGGALGNDLSATAQREAKDFGQHLSLDQR